MEHKRAHKSRKKPISSYLFYPSLLVGGLLAGILFYQIYVLFRQPHANNNDMDTHIDLSGVSGN